MAAVRSRDTTPERLVRSALHRAGVRFRLRQKIELPTRAVTPDLVFRDPYVLDFLKLVVDKDGNFTMPADDDIVAACLLCSGGEVKRKN